MRRIFLISLLLSAFSLGINAQTEKKTNDDDWGSALTENGAPENNLACRIAILGTLDVTSFGADREGTGVFFLGKVEDGIGYWMTWHGGLGFQLGQKGIATDVNGFNMLLNDATFGVVSGGLRAFKPVGKAHIFLEWDNRFYYGKGKDAAKNEYDLMSFSTGVRPAILYRVNDWLGIEMTYGFLGYRFMQQKFDNIKYSQSRFDLDVNAGTMLFTVKYFLN